MNKVYKVLSVLSICCLSLLIAPFHISANSSLSAPFVGYNVYIYDADSMTYVSNYDIELDMSGLQFTCSNMQSSGGCMTYRQSGSSYENTGSITLHQGTPVTNTIYKVDIILDDNYVGFVNITGGGYTKTWYVNGNIISFTWTDGQSTSQTITINSYELNLNSQSTWIYPIESYNFIDSFFKRGTEPQSLIPHNNYYFPAFKLKQNEVIWGQQFGSNDLIIIFAINKYVTSSNFSTYFEIPDGFSVTYTNIAYLPPAGNFSSARIVKYTFHRDDGILTTFRLKYIGSDTQIMPIYANLVTNQYVSTDFALQFGLKNPLLNALDVIANGTSSSQSSQSDLGQKTDDLNNSSNQLVTQEDSFNDDMNSALQNIDTDFNFGTNFGSKFIASADWVKTQYDRITGNTPFGSVISFSLLIGLALLLVGKVFK